MYYKQQKMKVFYELNKKKVLSTYYLLFGLLTLIFITLIIVEYVNYENLISLKWFTIITLLVIVLPIIFIGEHFYIWYRKNKDKNNLILIRPYNELNKLGFENETILKNLKGYKYYIQYASINGIQVLFDVNKPYVAEFIILCDTRKLNTRQFLEKNSELKKEKFVLDLGSLKREINHKKEKVSSQEITEILNEMTTTVKINNFPLLNITEDGEY